MPVPNSGESQKEFVARCIPYLIHEGKHPNSPEGRKAAAGECYGIWRSKHKSEVKSGLKDNKGYFCRLDNSQNKYYYDANDIESKKSAILRAEEELINLLTNEKSEDKKKPKVPNPDEPGEEAEPGEETEEWKKSMDIPSKLEDIKVNSYILYKGKISKVLKVLE